MFVLSYFHIIHLYLHYSLFTLNYLLSMSLLDKIYLWDKKQVIHDIFDLYASKSVFVNYLYFANMMHQRLLEKPQNKQQQKYRRALELWDFLLADGIALQLFYRFGIGRKSKTMPHNLNGTDLFPEIMKHLSILQAQGKKIHMAWYTLYDPKIHKTKKEGEKAAKKVFDEYGIHVNFLYQWLYAEREQWFDVQGYKNSLKDDVYDIYVFCNFTWTPFQEIWTEEHRSLFEQNRTLVLNQGGTIDFLSGFEKRAPRWVVKSRILETPRRILHQPKKNFKKLWWMFGIIRYWIKRVKMSKRVSE